MTTTTGHTLILGIESSCDETSAAVYESRAAGPGFLRSSVVSSQVDVHAPFGGVVPELSARAHVERLPTVTAEALRQAGILFSDIDALAVTSRPGLLSALLCGISYARGLSLALHIPLYAVDHIKAHVVAAFLEPPPPGCRGSCATTPDPVLTLEDLPALALVTSGGHTLLLQINDPVDFEVIGTTRDDAVGETFDKVGQMLDLAYPGGPQVERAAEGGNTEAFRFPIGAIRGAPLDFSFSGLKTSVLYTLADMTPKQRNARRADVAASFQFAAIRALVERASAAVRATNIRRFILCGGVAANQTLRRALAVALAVENTRLFVPPMVFCGDTAAQIAVMGSFLLRAGHAPAGQSFDAATTSELFEAAG